MIFDFQVDSSLTRRADREPLFFLPYFAHMAASFKRICVQVRLVLITTLPRDREKLSLCPKGLTKYNQENTLKVRE